MPVEPPSKLRPSASAQNAIRSVITSPDWDRLARTKLLHPRGYVPALSEDPASAAVLAIADPKNKTKIYIMGVDNDWRRLIGRLSYQQVTWSTVRRS